MEGEGGLGGVTDFEFVRHVLSNTNVSIKGAEKLKGTVVLWKVGSGGRSDNEVESGGGDGWEGKGEWGWG